MGKWKCKESSVREKVIAASYGVILMLAIKEAGFEVLRAKNSKEKGCFWLLVKKGGVAE